MTPLSCNCLSRPAPSLVILCSEPTRRSPGIVSCSGSHQPVQTLTPPPSAFPPFYSPPPLFCRGRSCWCSPLAVPLADSPHLLSELTQEASCPHFLLNSYACCQLHKHVHWLNQIPGFFATSPRGPRDINTAHAQYSYPPDSTRNRNRYSLWPLRISLRVSITELIAP